MAEDFRRPFFTIGHSTRSIEEMAELLRKEQARWREVIKTRGIKAE